MMIGSFLVCPQVCFPPCSVPLFHLLSTCFLVLWFKFSQWRLGERRGMRDCLLPITHRTFLKAGSLQTHQVALSIYSLLPPCCSFKSSSDQVFPLSLARGFCTIACWLSFIKLSSIIHLFLAGTLKDNTGTTEISKSPPNLALSLVGATLTSYLASLSLSFLICQIL